MRAGDRSPRMGPRQWSDFAGRGGFPGDKLCPGLEPAPAEADFALAAVNFIEKCYFVTKRFLFDTPMS